jgi:hypothetical protein
MISIDACIACSKQAIIGELKIFYAIFLRIFIAIIMYNKSVMDPHQRTGIGFGFRSSKIIYSYHML